MDSPSAPEYACPRLPYPWLVLAGFAIAKLLLHLFTAQSLGFQRDELLYRALGRHLDWGFWSNPPFIGLMGRLAAWIPCPDLWATRFLPALAGAVLVFLVLDLAWRLGGRVWALLFCGSGMLFSIAWLRTFSMLQPVPFDVLFWTLTLYAWARYLLNGDVRWWWGAGLAIGLGLLNKYTVFFLGWGMLAAMLLTAERRTLRTAGPWMATGVALVMFVPNLLWQWQFGFPVFRHMEELAAHQLRNVEPVNFMVDQLLFHGPGVLVWLPGLVGLLLAPRVRVLRSVGWCCVVVLSTFLLMSGKSYYTLGIYPVLFTAGAVMLEAVLKPVWSRVVLLGLMTIGSLPLLPVGLPLMKPAPMAAYLAKLGIDGAVRWEDGRLHELPQDFADMLGWPELAAMVDRAVAEAGTPGRVLIYAENYGQAGAVEQFARNIHPPMVVSFSDSYRLWAPMELPDSVHTLIYINDEPGEDVKRLFADIRLVDSLAVPMARERGTCVYLCRSPQQDIRAFWRERIRTVRATFNR